MGFNSGFKWLNIYVLRNTEDETHCSNSVCTRVAFLGSVVNFRITELENNMYKIQANQ